MPRFAVSTRSLCLALVAAISTFAPRAHAQQNLFNVPSAEITRPNTVFYQQQFNVNSISQTNASLAYGVGREYEIGVNFFQVNVIPEAGQNPDHTSPLFLVNAQKGFFLSDSFKLGVGTQIGETVEDRRRDVRLANFNYLTGVVTLPDEKSRLYVGGYDANPAFRGDRGDEFGFMVGYDIPTFLPKVDLVGDYLSGRSAISTGVLGAVWDVTDNWQFSLGAQLPGWHSGNAYGAVIELTLIPHHGEATVPAGGILLGAPPDSPPQ